jgi:hypothetical protein
MVKRFRRCVRFNLNRFFSALNKVSFKINKTDCWYWNFKQQPMAGTPGSNAQTTVQWGKA